MGRTNEIEKLKTLSITKENMFMSEKKLELI